MSAYADEAAKSVGSRAAWPTGIVTVGRPRLFKRVRVAVDVCICPNDYRSTGVQGEFNISKRLPASTGQGHLNVTSKRDHPDSAVRLHTEGGRVRPNCPVPLDGVWTYSSRFISLAEALWLPSKTGGPGLSQTLCFCPLQRD